VRHDGAWEYALVSPLSEGPLGFPVLLCALALAELAAAGLWGPVWVHVLAVERGIAVWVRWGRLCIVGRCVLVHRGMAHAGGHECVGGREHLAEMDAGGRGVLGW
jgi:hypothetical protein